MRNLFIALFCLGLTTAAHAANPFRCTGFDSSGARVMTVAASGQSITQIRNLRLTWQSSWPVKLTLPIVQKTEKYTPRSPRYKGLEKWVVDVANGPACKWDLLLPPADSRSANWTGFSQTACDSYYETITLRCTSN